MHLARPSRTHKASSYRRLVLLLTLFLEFLAPRTGFAQEQPTSLNLSPTQGYAGADCYTVTVGNGSNMVVDFRYTFNNGLPQEFSDTMNAAGQQQYCPDHYTQPGIDTFIAIKNHSLPDWVELTPVNYQLFPPKPTSLSISPSSVTAGQGSYTMTAGRGDGVTLDVKYRLDNGPEQTIPNWPTLGPASPSPNGQVSIPVANCTPPGIYTYTSIKNTLNDDTTWQAVNASVTVTSAPAVASVSPAGAGRGSTVSVTINGRNLCNVSLSTAWPGLTFTNVTSDGSSATATFIISASASVGDAAITLSADYGTTAFTFSITNNASPVITAVMPSSGVQGSSVSVTITGNHLATATLSTTWNGLTFSNINSNSNGTSLTATFNVSATAALGSPPIQVATSAGSTTTQLFSITSAGLVLSKEYIYVGGRMVAIDGPANDPIPPTSPSGLTASDLTSTGVRLTWTASSDSGGSGLAGYKVYRSGTLVSGSIPIATTSFNDTGLISGTPYSYTVTAHDNAGNASLSTSPLSVTTLGAGSTDTIPPTTPTGLTAIATSLSTVRLDWTASTDNVGGSGLAGYNAYRSGILVSGTNSIAMTSFIDTGLTPNTTYSYTVSAVDNAGNVSASSSAVSVTTPVRPGSPANLTASATSTTEVSLTWTASSTAGATYQIERSSNNSGYSMIATSTTPAYVDTSATAGITYLYRVRAVDGAGTVSSYTNVDLATTIMFTDDPLTVGVTLVRAQHFNELRQSVNAVRTTAGLAAASWTDPILDGLVIKAVHLQELRDSLNAAITALGLGAPAYTDPSLTVGATVIKKVHIDELRERVK